MSESDSFISEVTEEVRRDRMFSLMKRWGWLAVVLVLALVGGAAWNEYDKAQTAAEAQATGDALLDGLSNDDAEARAAALMGIEAEGATIAVTSLTIAASQQEAGDLEGAAATLDELAQNGDVPAIYRDLAALKRAMLNVDADPAQKREGLQALSNPGQPFRLLALEQLAYFDLEQGERDSAIATLREIMQDSDVTRGLNERAQLLMVALGEEAEPASDLMTVTE
ncbi:MAG: tetratricopeptide repeat protein [Paracoccaceae bacterium]